MNLPRLILPLLLLLCIHVQGKERIIERPPFISWSSTSIEVDRVILSDNATVLDIKAFYRPNNWIKIASGSFLIDNIGRKYPIQGGDGITLDEEFWMPESGEAGFKLIFPPLPDGVEYVDFSEGDDIQGAFKIWGIQLNGELPPLRLPAEVRNLPEVDKNAALPLPEIDFGKATFSGKVLDYRPGMDTNLIIYVMHNVGTGEEMQVPVAPDGSFSMDVSLCSAAPCLLVLNYHIIGNFFLAPEQETSLYINQREMAREQSKLRNEREEPYGKSLYYSGFMAGVSSELADNPIKVSIDNNHGKIVREIGGKSIPEIKDYIISDNERLHQEIDAANISNATKQILRMNADLMSLEALSSIKWYYVRAYAMQNNITDRDEIMKFSEQPLDIPESIFDEFARFKDLNTPYALYCNNYGVMASNAETTARLSKALGTDQGIFFEMSKVNGVLRKIDEFTPATDDEMLELQSMNTGYYQLANEKNEKLLATIEANKKKAGFRRNEAGEVANEDLFASLIAPFSGKTILVDFWATWCGPCRTANKEMAPMKEEFKDKDIVYLYIAGDNSPEKTWENMIPDIPGEHYRVSASQWKYLTDTFKVEGVPTYLIVNKEGEVAFRTVGYPGVAKMKEEIEKTL